MKYIFYALILSIVIISCNKNPEQITPSTSTMTPTITATFTITATVTLTRTPFETSTPVVYRFETGNNGWTFKTPDIYPQSAGFIDWYINTETVYIYSGLGSLGINCLLQAEPMARRGDLSIDLSSSPAGMFGKTIMARVLVTPELASLVSNPYQIMSFIVPDQSSSVIFGTPISMTTTGWNEFVFSVDYDGPVKMVGIRIKSKDGASALKYEGPVFIDEINW